MHERFLLVEHTVALLLLFTAIGSGPAVGLIRDQRLRLVTMPILGFALAASVLVTSAYFITMATATWVLLVPAAAVSIVTAVVLGRRQPATGRAREVAIPAAVFLVGVVLALFPAISRGTQGPFALAVWDAWGYSESSLYLQHHTTGTVLPAGVERTDLSTWDGASFANDNYSRIGVDVVNASAATLFRSSTPESLAPFLAVLFGLIPLAIWLTVRGFGGSWQAAAFGSALGLTPAILSLVEDTTLGNLAGAVLAAPALFYLLRRRRGFIPDAVVAGALLGGLIAVYPEFMVPLFIVAACCGLVFGIVRARGGAFREWVRFGALRIGVAAVTTFVIAPYATYRAFHYLSARKGDGPWANGLPPRYLNVENVGSWAFGVRHLYDMATFSTLPGPTLAFAIYFPVVLAVVVLFGVARLRALGVFVVAPILVTGALGIYAYHHFQSGRCEYCLWKALTFMIPFLAVGLAFGIERLWRGGGERGSTYLQKGIVASIAIVALVAIGNSDKRLIQTTRSVGASCPCGFGDLGRQLDRLPSRAPVLIEGVDTMPHPTFTLNSAYFAARGHKRTVLFDAGFPAIAYLATLQSAPTYYSPKYAYVLTPFEKVRTNRKPLGHYGPLLLERRAPIDVVVSAPGWTVDSTGIPRGSTPFTLRVSSRRAVRAAITISLSRLTSDDSALTFKSGQTQLETIATNRSSVCVDVRLQKGSTTIGATPVFGPLTAPLPNELGLAVITAAPGPCGKGRRLEPVSLTDGWFPVEPSANGALRWMGSDGIVEIGTPGAPRPGLRIEAQVKSFLRSRRIDVWLAEKRLASFEVSQTRTAKIAITVPPGQGAARLLFVPSPGAESASLVTPSDSRLLSMALSAISIQPTH